MTNRFTRHLEVPVFENQGVTLNANYYNHVQVALKRLGGPIRLSIPKLKTLDLILQDDAWVIVDRAFNDIPIAAWTDFEVKKRDNLYEPIKCRKKLYHAHGNIILGRTLEAMEMLLGEALDSLAPESDGGVIPFHRDH
ncbi:MAG: hypothetical protein OEY67_03480 [Gammaproteobacteria bacterium]|nr:hypothetical protein [Gammaproteobacteria bacterium]